MLRFIIILLLSGFYVTSQLLGLDEGSRCLWNGNPGHCVSIFKCLSSFIDLEDKSHPPICSFRGKEPIICCTDCEFVNDTRKMIIDDAFGILYKTGQKSEDACTEFKHKVNYPCKEARLRTYHYLDRTYDKERRCWPVKIKITIRHLLVVSDNAERAQFPHMALLGYGPDVDTALWLCGGTLISERFILTAGHCSSQSKIGEVKYIALGILRRSDPPEYWQKYEVKRIIPHPEYHPPSKYNDIALLETTKKIIFGESVRPACLHTKGEAELTLSTTGWGALGHKKQLADTLQTINITRYEEDDCSKHYPPHRLLKNGYNHTTQMCYGDKLSVKDSCEGDSGGPLQSLNYDELGCVFTVLGVTSAGKQCGISAGSGLYTRVYHYVPWIESIVWP